VYRGDIERTADVATRVSKIRPVKKSRNAKTEIGKSEGSKSIMNIGIVTNNQATPPQRATPSNARKISFFLASMWDSFQRAE